MRVILIHNAGAGDDVQPGCRQLIELIRKAGHEVVYQSADDQDWGGALDEPADLIAVAGGDGTVGRVAKRMVGRDVPMAVLPMGTANNISRTLGVADVPFDRLIQSWDCGRVDTLDVWIAQGPWDERRFIEGLGVGLFAWTMPEADASGTLASLESADSKIAYALQMLKDRLDGCPPIALRATLDGDDLSGDYVMFQAMNAKYIGPNLYLAPNADPGDGYLDVVMVTEAEREKLREYLSDWQDGALRRARLPSRRGKRLTVQWTGFDLHIDDDLWPDDAATHAAVSIEVTLDTQAVRYLALE